MIHITYIPLQQSQRVLREFWDGSIMIIDGVVNHSLELSNNNQIDLITLDNTIYNDTDILEYVSEEFLAESAKSIETMQERMEWLISNGIDEYESYRDEYALVAFNQTIAFVSFDFFTAYKEIYNQKQQPTYQLQFNINGPYTKTFQADDDEAARVVAEKLMLKLRFLLDFEFSEIEYHIEQIK